MSCKECGGFGIIPSGDGWHEPKTETFCECEAGIEAEQRDAVSFAALEAIGLPPIENVKAVAA